MVLGFGIANVANTLADDLFRVGVHLEASFLFPESSAVVDSNGPDVLSRLAGQLNGHVELRLFGLGAVVAITDENIADVDAQTVSLAGVQTGPEGSRIELYPPLRTHWLHNIEIIIAIGSANRKREVDQTLTAL